MRISDWSSDVCSSDLRCHEIVCDLDDVASLAGGFSIDDVLRVGAAHDIGEALLESLRLRLLLRGDKGLDGARWLVVADAASWRRRRLVGDHAHFGNASRSEEHTSELQSLMRISYAVFC